MLKQRQAAIANVAAAFIPTEKSAEHAAASAARCVAIMIEERANANLPIVTGVDVLELMAEGTLHAVQAHVRFVKAHAQLRDIPASIGVTNYGVTECEPNQAFVIGKNPLRVAA